LSRGLTQTMKARVKEARGSILTFKDKFALQLVRPTYITLHLENDIPSCYLSDQTYVSELALQVGDIYICFQYG